MGDFSQDSKIRLAHSIKKHYVGVRMQQGVPILDADWNEMEDLRKHELYELFTQFIGSGVPTGSDGFRIMETPGDNNFAIRNGIILVKGKRVINQGDNITYLDQSNSELVDTLNTPTDNTTYIVYLDTWEREIDGQDDPVLIDERIGIETCIRLKREWVVRVDEGSSPGSLPPEPEGHLYHPLAIIERTGENDRITFDMITDLRRTHLNLAENTKVPLALYGVLGNMTYSLDNFSDLLDLTDKAYFNLLKSDLFMTDNFESSTALESVMISTVFNEIMQIARTASVQAKIGNLNNQDGVKILETLYYAQDHFVSTIEELIAGDPTRASTSSFLLKLREYLDGGSRGTPPGLKNAVITRKDIKAGIDAQQEINREIGSRTLILPHGHLVVKFVSGPPAGTTIEAGNTYKYKYDITFERKIAGPAQSETFDLLPAMNPPGWSVSLIDRPGGTVVLETDETTSVSVGVSIPHSTSIASAVLHFQVKSRNNPAEMDTTNTEVELTVDEVSEPPNPLVIDLLLPSINVEEDILPVGRGGPVGLPGKGVNLRFRFTYLEEVTAAENFTVKFVSTPTGAFMNVTDKHIKLGGDEGQEHVITFGFQATSTAVNGTSGTLKVTMEKDSDPEVSRELDIMLEVQKGS